MRMQRYLSINEIPEYFNDKVSDEDFNAKYECVGANPDDGTPMYRVRPDPDAKHDEE